ncbi:hypothetical protein NQ176_g1823 [Zarea fungicola]|uniref:Uncharacterized protein n=1 Tax=Zarea fungicola TaxID=93591 RepID=A0ACC1NR15_9HYPO|nr:hypothetical protein NQ176_g1823 [Lecanicillium fungicola]
MELALVQRLDTSGARALERFQIDSETYLAIPQLACDIPGGEPGMNLGDSNTTLHIYKENTGTGLFSLVQQLDVPGGEDAEYFSIDGRHFLATASLRSGSGPYNLGVHSTIHEWDTRSSCFHKFQSFPTFAAKQWHYFRLGDLHFLALAQGVTLPGLAPDEGVSPDSTIFKWDGAEFQPFQRVPSAWGYNWLHFNLDGFDFLAYADHVSPSVILKWDGTSFVHFQTLDGQNGRAFCLIEDNKGTTFLGFARISTTSLLYSWTGAEFKIHSELNAVGGREFASMKHEEATYLFLVRFITGDRSNPDPDLASVAYKLQDGKIESVHEFNTMGGTDAITWVQDDQAYLAVSESLTKEHRFRTDTRIYQVNFKSSVRDIKMNQTLSPTHMSYQSPEFLDLFAAFTGPNSAIRPLLINEVTGKGSPLPLIVATNQYIFFFPGGSKEPAYINFRIGNRGFKEISAISHLGPLAATFVQMKQHNVPADVWRASAKEILKTIEMTKAANSVELWRDRISVQAFRGRETAIAAMADYALAITRSYLEAILEDEANMTPEFLRDSYLEATNPKIGATVPFNAIMIATFFLVGLDISYRMRQWLQSNTIDWKAARVLITGRVGRETSGVTISSNSIAQSILQASNLELELEQLYIVPHVEPPNMPPDVDIYLLRKHEHKFRALLNQIMHIEELGGLMFEDYPVYKLPRDSQPSIDKVTISVSELPKISKPDDWLAMNTRLRVVLEDSRQLLSGCVTDYAAEQLRIFDCDLDRVVVPGLDGVDFGTKESVGYPRYPELSQLPESFTLSSCPFPIPTDLPVPVQTFISPSDGAALAYRETNTANANHVIWIHGLPLDSRSWAAQYSRFADSYHNVFLDLRGYGQSAKFAPDATGITQIYCDDLCALMDHLNLSDASIVAFASAAHVALRFAAQQPNRVKNLVLLNGSPRFMKNTTDYQFGFTQDVIQNRFLAAADTSFKCLLDTILEPADVFQDLDHDDIAKVDSWFRAMANTAGIHTVRKFFDDIVNDDDRHLLPAVRARTLLLTPSLGKEVPSQTAMYLKQNLHNAKLVEIPDADHFFNVTRPVIVNELIAGFLKFNLEETPGQNS